MTTDLRRRFEEHQSGSSRSTKGRRPWKLIYYEAYREESDAEGREVFLKSGGGRRFLDKQLRNHFAQFPRRDAT
jgi:putative endonuclease